MLLTFCFALFTYASIRLYSTLPFAIYAFFPFCCFGLLPVQIFFIIAFYPFAYEISSTLIKETMPSVLNAEINLEDGRNGFEKKYLERLIASCAPVKCYIGNTYYMKASTKLIFINFFSNLTMYLLLTF